MDGNEIKGIYVHTPVSNTAAIEFYQKLGFKITENIPEYYKSLNPPDAVIIEKRFDWEN